MNKRLLHHKNGCIVLETFEVFGNNNEKQKIVSREIIARIQYASEEIEELFFQILKERMK